jgi:indole-3-glycerol phosphate synthase
MNILEEIFAHKRTEIDQRKQARPLDEVRAEAEETPIPADFVATLRAAKAKHDSPALIAEVKFASPSKGVMVTEPDPLGLARTYQQNGAAAISVLTDEKYFRGHLDYLRQVSALQPGLPTLRKDFVCDEYQLYEARAAGASAVLLIAAMLSASELLSLHASARKLGLTPLVEVHNRQELEGALACNPLLVGVNNRDLRDFSVSLGTSLRLRAAIPDDVCMVAESGIHNAADVATLKSAGVDAILVGEALVLAEDTPSKVRELSGATQ